MNPDPPPPPESLLQHTSFVRGVARAVLRGDDRVEDVLQDTWVVALEQADRRRGPLRPWLAGIARHKALRVLRGERRKRRVEAALEPSAPAPSAAALAARAETGRRVASAVLQLDEPYRETVLLRYHEGLKPREIAARQGVPVETVKTRLRRGLERLRTRLAADDDDRRRLALLMLGGGVAMKKSIAFVFLALLLLVGGGIALSPWLLDVEDRGPAEEGAAPISRAAEDEDARLAGRGEAAEAEGAASATLVDLEAADRDHDLFGVVVDPEGTPFSGARLVAVRYPWTERSLMVYDEHAAEAVEIARTRSDENGAFRLRLGQGRVVALRVEAEGYASLEVQKLQAGERARVVLRPSVALRLRVLDERKRPVPGAWCRVRHAMEARHAFLATGTTDADGVFLAAGLPAGAAVMAWAVGTPAAPGYAAHRDGRLPLEGELVEDLLLAPTALLRGRVLDRETEAPIGGAKVSTSWAMIPAVSTDASGAFELVAMAPAATRAVYVAADGYARDRFEVDATGEATVRLSRGWSIAGRVVNDLGQPIQGVLLRAAGTVARDATRNHSLALGRTAEDGRFTLGGFRDGLSHVLVVLAEGHGTVMLDLDAPEASPLVLGDVVLPAAATLHGAVKDEHGAPLAGVAVTLGGSPDGRDRLRTTTGYVGWLFSGAAERRTDDQGRFRFPDLAPGTYSLRAANGAGGAAVAEVRVDGGDVVHDLVLPSTRVVCVTFKGPEGQVTSGWSVRPEIVGMPRTWHSPGADGRARFAAPRSEILVFTWVRADLPFHVPPRMHRVRADQDELVVTLRPASLVRGRLVDDEDEPIAAAMVRATWKDGGRSSTTTAADGAFVLRVDPGVQADVGWDGRVASRTTMAGLERRMAMAEAKGVKPGASELRLRAHDVLRDRTFRVRLLDPAGRPVEGAEVTLLHVTADPVTTDGEGRARFENVPALPIQARWSLRPSAERPWFVETSERVVPQGLEIVIQARLAATIEGRVLQADGSAAAGATVYSRRGGASRGYGTADATGRFVLYVDPDDAEPHVVETYWQDTKKRRMVARSAAVAAGQGGVRIRLPAPGRGV